MIRKLLCWLGWHEWETRCCFKSCQWLNFELEQKEYCPYRFYKCKHCGKVKK